MYFNPRLGDFFISKVDSSTWCARCKGSDVSDQPDEQDPLLDGGILDRGASYQSEKEESYSSKSKWCVSKSTTASFILSSQSLVMSAQCCFNVQAPCTILVQYNVYNRGPILTCRLIPLLYILSMFVYTHVIESVVKIHLSPMHGGLRAYRPL